MALALAEILAKEYPDLYAHLLTRQLPADWTPDPSTTAQLLGNLSKADCRTCAAPKAEFRCRACGTARYCSPECQRLDWTEHKQWCKIDGAIKGALKATLHDGHTL